MATKRHPLRRGASPRHGLTRLARERGLTIAELAARCGTTHARLGNVVAGVDALHYPLLCSLSRALRVTQRIVFDAWRESRQTWKSKPVNGIRRIKNKT